MQFALAEGPQGMFGAREQAELELPTFMSQP